MNRFAKLWTALFLALCLHANISHAQMQIQGPRASADAFSGVVYGPIDSSDTLWRIASRYKQDSQFTVFQTMLAIYQLNPRAFENNNFNTMIDGAILQLPSDSYIARIDPQRARAKAEADERSYAARVESLQLNNNRPTAVTEQAPAEPLSEGNLKDSPPLVNQEDLSNTQRQLQNQLNALNRQQNTQFEAVKDQVSASIENVQSLIDENKKLYDRLDQVNNDIADLRSKVEGEMQSQIDEQLAMQRELLELIKAEQAKEVEAAESDWIKTLTSPTGLIIISTTGTLLVLGLVAYLLLRRKPEQEEQVVQQAETVKEPEVIDDIIDDELVIGEAIDEIDEDADELLKALSEDAEEDDVLSEQLEDGLDELNVDDDMDDFAALEDEMLVPDSPATTKAEDVVEDGAEELVNFDADAISLDDEDDFDNQSIDLSADGDIDDEVGESVEPYEGQKDSQAVNKIAVDASSSEVPEGIQLNEDGEVDDNTIEMIGQKIQQKDAEITQLTNEILEEIENAELENADSESSDLIPTEVDELSALAEESGLDESIASDVAAQLEGTAEPETSIDLEDASKTESEADELESELPSAVADELSESADEPLDEGEAESKIDLDANDIDIDALIDSQQDITSGDDAQQQSNDVVIDLSEADKLKRELPSAVAEEISDSADEPIDKGEAENAIDLDANDIDIDDIDALIDSQQEITTSDDSQHQPDETTEEVSEEGESEETPVSAVTESDEIAEQETSSEKAAVTEIEEQAPTTEIADHQEVSEQTPEPEIAAEHEATIDAEDDAVQTSVEESVVNDSELQAEEASQEDAPGDEDYKENLDVAAESPQDAQPTDSVTELESEPDSINSLSDEITEQLEDDIIADEELDSLLDEFTAEMEASGLGDEILDSPSESSPMEAVGDSEDILATDETPQNQENDALSEELINELENEVETTEELDSLLDEIAETETEGVTIEDIAVDDNAEQSDDDILGDLPEIDDWQDSTDTSTEEANIQVEPEVELNIEPVEQELEDQPATPSAPTDRQSSTPNIDKPEIKSTQSNPLDEAGLDLDALMTDKEDPDFTNVDDLLAESESFPPLSDDDLELNLDGSLDKLMEPSSDDFEFSSENYQASNLDLAQIYIDMEDFESATDVLQEVLESGNSEQQKEAQSLLKEIEKA